MRNKYYPVPKVNIICFGHMLHLLSWRSWSHSAHFGNIGDDNTIHCSIRS